MVLAAGETYPLSIAGPNEDASATGDLDVTGNITIVGNGSTIDAGAIDRVIEVQHSGRLRLQGLTVTGGRAQLAGGVRIDPGATAAISASTISGNEAYGFYRCITDALTGGPAAAVRTRRSARGSSTTPVWEAAQGSTTKGPCRCGTRR